MKSQILKPYSTALVTPRTIIRPLLLCDAQKIYELNKDHDVIRYTGDKPFERVIEAMKFIANYKQFSDYGIGRWAVIEKESHNFIGWCGIKYTPELNEYDIGFRFFKSYWNRGFATETAYACLEFGFEQKKISRIVGRAMKANKASVKVLQKLGMIEVEERACGGEAGMVYQIDQWSFEYFKKMQTKIG